MPSQSSPLLLCARIDDSIWSLQIPYFRVRFFTMLSMKVSPLKTFIIYAREDRDALLELKAQLIPLERKGDLAIWYDGEILPGQNWNKAIKQNLEQADLILLFISKYFFNSDYIEKTELQSALNRHREGKSILIPIIVRPCVWEDYFDMGEFQALPEGAQPIFSKHWHSPDEAFVSVAHGIRRLVRHKREKEEAEIQVSEIRRQKTQDMTALEREIEEIKEQKNLAVKNQQYDEAADLRDTEAKMVRDLNILKNAFHNYYG